MSKFAAPIHELPPDPAIVADRRAQRRRDDKVGELEQGFTFRPSGSDGYIYLRNGARILELYWEVSGVADYDILLSLAGLRQWVLPPAEPIEVEEWAAIQAKLRDWLSTRNIRALIQDECA